MMKSICLTTVLFFFLYCPAQNLDSLRNAANKELRSAEKAKLYLLLAEQTVNFNPDTSVLYARKGLEFAKSAKEEISVIRAEYFLAVYNYKTGNLDSILYFTRKNTPKLLDNKDEETLLSNYINLEGNYYMRTNQQKEALERFYHALSVADRSGDPLGKIKGHTNIGFAHMELNQFEKAITEFKTAAQLMQQHNLNRYATVYNNLASCFGSLGELDSAKKYVSLGITTAKKNNDLVSEANGLNILGTLYNEKKQYRDALQVFIRAREIREKIGDPFFIVSDMSSIADLYTRMGEPHKAIDISKEALRIAEENRLTAKLPLIYQSLASSYEAAGDCASSTAVYKKISALKDSLYAGASPQALAEMETKYKTEQKERQIEEQKHRIARQNWIIIGAIAGVVFLLLLGYTQYRRYKWKQEARMRDALLKQQELATKAVLEAEEGERQRIAKDLHDGVGQMMSAAKMNLSAFEHEAGFKNTEEKLAFEKIILLVDESCREVRTVSHNMMPNALLKNSLASAIREFIDKLDEKKLKVHLYTEGLDTRLDSNIETVLYRVIQECVNNVIKHSGANTLDISLVREDGEIRATIEDNGKGFDATATQNEGIGLKNIRTRIEYLKGNVEFDSQPGRGTLVALHVPL